MKHKTRRRPAVYIAQARTVARTCPVCAGVLDGVTCLASDRTAITTTMEPGDITCCAYCRTLLTVTPDGFVPVTEAALDQVEPRLRAILLDLAMPSHARPS